MGLAPNNSRARPSRARTSSSCCCSAESAISPRYPAQRSRTIHWTFFGGSLVVHGREDADPFCAAGVAGRFLSGRFCCSMCCLMIDGGARSREAATYDGD